MQPHQPVSKVITEAALTAHYGRPRDIVVVFTNGVFDILHRGHVEYLFAARALGDALVVGLNTDASVRRLKGPARPVNGEDDRAFVLAGLACVDAVTMFDEDTPERLIGGLLPDVLVKGADYRPDQIAGHEAVLAAGGRVETIALVPGRSTTETIRRLREPT